MTVQFMCPACGGASIAVPALCAQEAEITCGSCGNVLGTWGEFKERATLWPSFSGGESASPELSIIIPTFNEIGNVSEVIRRISRLLKEVSWEIIVVDDDSPDGT